MILVFDLDDTLYDEITYVRSSLLAVAKYLSKILQIHEAIIYQELTEILEKKGRGSVFDDVLKNHGAYSKAQVNKCLSVYRNNIPEIKLFDQAIDCLKRFADFPKYLVTDGNKFVQKKKIKTLKLNRYFKKAIPTHDFGVMHSKPSTYVFHKILKWENASPHQLVYIGDNPNKDFVNLKKEKFKTIRVLSGFFKNLRIDDEYEAHYTVNSLNEIDLELIETLNKNNENRKI